jgi:hypothetical protein
MIFQVNIQSDSWTWYDHYSTCYYSFYAPGAKTLTLYFYAFDTQSGDNLYVYFGTGPGAYSNYHYGDKDGGKYVYHTDLLYLSWSTNSYDNDVGFNGYVQRLD